MARLSVTVTVASVFFLLLEVAIARSLYQNDVAVRDSVPLPQSAGEPLLRLPSRAVNDDDDAHPRPDPDAEATDVPESKPISLAAKADAQVRDIPESSDIAVRSVPLTLINFHDLRPINRHFPLRSRFRRFPCRHSHPFFKPMKRAARISFGDDMIISSAEEEGGKDVDQESWFRTFRLPYHHHHHHPDGGDDEIDGIPKFVLKHSHRFGKEEFKKNWRKRVDDDDSDSDDDEEEDDDEKEKGEKRFREERKKRKEEKKKEKKGGFVKRIRKFLDHHF